MGRKSKTPGVLALLVFITGYTNAQALLGANKSSIKQLFPDCTAIDKYSSMLVINCAGVKNIFYFNADSVCDMYARDMDRTSANDTLQKLLTSGFTKTGVKYVEPFLVSKKSNHEKFPSQIYSNGTIQYCFMPVSLNGKSAETNAVIVMYPKKELK
jgi:hypothetical protein